MAIPYRVGVDWDNNNFFAWNARPIDPINLDDTSDMGSVTRSVSAGTSAIAGTIPTDYGKNYVLWTPGVTPGVDLRLGYNGVSAYDYSVPPFSSRQFAVWVFGDNAASNGVGLTASAVNSAGTVLTSDAQTITQGSWTKFYVNAVNNTGSSLNVYCRIRKNGSSNSTFRVAGLMFMNGGGIPNAYNTGDSSRYEYINDFVIDMQWNIGFKEAYQFLADENRLSITLRNDTFYFSPEIGVQNPIPAGSNRQVRVEAQNSSESWFRMYTGFVNRIVPAPLLNGPKTATLTATTLRRFLEKRNLPIALIENQRVDQAITTLLANVPLPAGFVIESSLQQGNYTYPYIYDNIFPEEKDVLQTLAMLCEAERGKGYFARNGGFVLRNRTFFEDAAINFSALHTFADDFVGASYDYGDKLINDVKIMFYRRKVSATSDKILWESEENIVLTAGEVRTFRVYFTNENQNKRISAKNVTHTITVDGTGVTVSLGAVASSCTVTLTNTAGVTRTVTAMTLRGTKITTFNAAEVRALDGTSLTNYGLMPMQINNPLTATQAEAQTIANYELNRFKEPFGRFKWIKLIPRTTIEQNRVISAGLNNFVEIRDSQITSTFQNYIIIGEEHRVSEGMQKHETTYYLERIS